jgi:leader peptidase (prepilin peptidase)/N-methyltransferase
MSWTVVAVGLALGSFVSMVVYRLPRDEGMVFSRSRCTLCGHQLGPLELVPVLSFVWLRGRCLSCRGRISWRYPLVELLTAALLSALWLVHGTEKVFWPYAAFTLVLIIVSIIDLDHFWIPDRVLWAGLLLWGLSRWWPGGFSLRPALLGGAVGLATMTTIYYLARGGMGLGDVKLAALMGLYLGPEQVALALMLAFVTGACTGGILVLLRRKGRKDRLPFGPFLAAGAYVAMMWGPRLVRWYLNLVGF